MADREVKVKLGLAADNSSSAKVREQARDIRALNTEMEKHNRLLRDTTSQLSRSGSMGGATPFGPSGYMSGVAGARLQRVMLGMHGAGGGGSPGGPPGGPGLPAAAGGGGPPGGPPRGPSVAGAMGFAATLGKWSHLARGALGLYGAGAVMHTINTGAAGMINAANNPLLSAAQGQRAGEESVPIIGSLIASFYSLNDAIKGVTGRIAYQDQQFGVVQTNQAAKLQYGQQQRNILGESDKLFYGSKYAAEAVEKSHGLGGLPSRRGTVAEERAYGVAERMLPLNIQSFSAEAAAKGARKEEDMARRNVMDLEFQRKEAFDTGDKWLKERTNLEAQEKAAGGFSGGTRKQAELDAAGKEYLVAQQNAETINNQLAAAGVALKEKGAAAAKAENDYLKVQTAIRREQVTIAKEQFAQTRGEFGAYGMLNPAQKTAALQAARQAKQFGFESLTPQQRGHLSGAGFGEYLQRESVASAARDPQLRQARAQLGLLSDIEGLQKKSAESFDVQIQTKIDEQKLANVLEERLVPVLDKINLILSDQVAIVVNKQKGQNFVRNNLAGK